LTIGYIKQAKIPIKLIDKIKYYLRLIEVEKIEESYVIKIPLKDKEIKFLEENNIKNMSEEKIVSEKTFKRIKKKIDRIISHLIKYIEKYDMNVLVLSNMFSKNVKGYSFEIYLKEVLKDRKYLKDEVNIYKNELYFSDGKKIIEYMQYEILEYIMTIQNKKLYQEDVYFLIKKDNKLDLEFLGKFIEKAKTVNIVTNDIDRFKKIQETIYKNENILISVSNNKSKALKRAKYIFNVNLRESDLEKLKINREAILIHLRENIKYSKNGFYGININSIKIKIPDEYIEKFEKIDQEILSEFELIKLYESMLLQSIYIKTKDTMIQLESNINNMYYDIADKFIKENEVEILELIGNKGPIMREELIMNIIKTSWQTRKTGLIYITLVKKQKIIT